MEYLKIVKDEPWGCQVVFLPLKEIRAMEHCMGPGQLTIYYLNKMICGDVEPDFDFPDLQWKVRNNEYCQVNIYQELPEREDEDASNS